MAVTALPVLEDNPVPLHEYVAAPEAESDTDWPSQALLVDADTVMEGMG